MPKKSSPKPSNTNIFKDLWEAATTMRGNIEPSDYKRYVLPIIFLRFLSLRCEECRAELEAQYGDPNSPDYIADEAVRQDILEDEDEYKRERVFIPPRESAVERG